MTRDCVHCQTDGKMAKTCVEALQDVKEKQTYRPNMIAWPDCKISGLHCETTVNNQLAILLSKSDEQICCSRTNREPTTEFLNGNVIPSELVDVAESLILEFWNKHAELGIMAIRVPVTVFNPFQNTRILECLWRRAGARHGSFLWEGIVSHRQ